MYERDVAALSKFCKSLACGDGDGDGDGRRGSVISAGGSLRITQHDDPTKLPGPSNSAGIDIPFRHQRKVGL